MALHPCFQPAFLKSPPHSPTMFSRGANAPNIRDEGNGLRPPPPPPPPPHPAASQWICCCCCLINDQRSSRFVRVPGEIKRSRNLRGGRWSWTLTFAQKRSWVGRWSGLSKLDVFCFELSKLFVNSGATDIVLVTLSSTVVETAIAQCTSRWAMARGHRLNTSIVLAAVHGLSGLFRAVSAVEPFTLSPPSHSVPVPNRPTRLCGRKATLSLFTSSGQ